MAGTTWWALLFTTAVGGALRFYHLGAHSVWLDELVSIEHSRSLVAAVSSFSHPPLFYGALHLWARVFGDSDAALRALAALSGTLCVPVMFAAALRAFRSERVALTAAFLLAIMPQSIWHARQVRHYALWPAFVLLALWSLLAQRDRSVSWRATLGYWVWTTVAMATHYYTAFYAAAHALAAWCLIGTRPFVKTRPEGRRWLVLHAPLLVVAVGILAYRQMRWGQLGVDVAGALVGNVARVGWWLGSLVFFRPWAFPDPPLSSVRWGAFLAVVLLAATVAMARDRTADRRTLWALSIMLWLPLFAIEILPVRSYPRLLTPTLSLIVLWLSYAAWTPLSSRWAQLARGVVVAVLIVRIVPYIGTVYTIEVEPWRSVCADVAANETERTVVLVNEPYMVGPLRHCYVAEAPIVRFPNRRRQLDTGNIVSFAAPYDEVWFVYSHAWSSDPRREGVRALMAAHELVDRQRYGPLLETYHLRRRSR